MKTMKTQGPYFRVGVGVILYGPAGKIICFNRTDNRAVWQFPQGGADAGETYDAALWRELYEETAVTKDMIESVTPYPDWTLYEYPPHLRAEMGSVVGQAHRWYFLELAPDAEPQLDSALDEEFCAWKHITMTDFLTLPNHDFKLPVYHQLADFYQKNVL